jgi:hypothetical protein
MFDPLRAPYAFELHALHRQEALLREAAHARLLRALARARGPSGRRAGVGRPGWGPWLVRLVGAQLVRWGYRLLPLPPPPRLPVGSSAGSTGGLLGRAIPPPRPRFGGRPGRRACRRPAAARFPRGLSLAGE